MGLRDLFRKRGDDPCGFSAESGTTEHPGALEAIAAVCDRLHAAGGHDVWGTFDAAARRGDEAHTVQVMRNTVNTCLEDVDLQRILDESGLAETVGECEKRDIGLFELGVATPDSLALCVDAIFLHHYGLKPPYWVRGTIEC